MEFSELITAFGNRLNLQLSLSAENTCGIELDDGQVTFELIENRLFLVTDLGSSSGHEGDLERILRAQNLGLETGFCIIGIDSSREQFTLCRVLEGEMDIDAFEKAVTLFVRTMRYWKEWIGLPPITQGNPDKNVEISPMEMTATELFSLRV